jgi:hypothetical protein
MEITTHGMDRVSQRIGREQLAENAFYRGKRFKQCSLRVKKYINWLKNRNPPETDIAIYADCVFIFRDKTLITAWKLPGYLCERDPNASASN